MKNNYPEFNTKKLYKKDRRLRGESIGLGETKDEVIFFLSDRDKEINSEEIIEYIKRNWSKKYYNKPIKNNSTIYKHIRDLYEEGLLKRTTQNGEHHYNLKDDTKSFKRICIRFRTNPQRFNLFENKKRLKKENNLEWKRWRFLSSKYFNRCFNKYYKDLINENLGFIINDSISKEEIKLQKSIIIQSPTAFNLLFKNVSKFNPFTHNPYNGKDKTVKKIDKFFIYHIEKFLKSTNFELNFLLPKNVVPKEIRLKPLTNLLIFCLAIDSFQNPILNMNLSASLADLS